LRTGRRALRFASERPSSERMRVEEQELRREEFDVVRAKRLELVDRADRVRAAMGPGPDGEVAMHFYDGAGQIKMEMAVGDDGRADLSLRDGSGQETALISVGDGDHATMCLTSVDQESGESWGVGLIGARREGESPRGLSLTLSEGGSPRLLVTLLKGGSPCIVMYDDQGNEVWGVAEEAGD
jgi:hypothetical protein